MDRRRAVLWAGLYTIVASLVTLLGLAIIGGGLAIGGKDVYDAYQATGDVTTNVLWDAAPGIAIIVLGIVVLQLGTALALFFTLPNAISEELKETYDNERVKSEILTVLDDRLSTMERELQQARDTGDEERGYDDSFELDD
jgi:hypothetical protein